MKNFNLFIAIVTLLLTACSTTERTIALEHKRPIVSDHYLMMSLLDRPITEDQKIMLAFANYQQQVTESFTPNFVHSVSILGEKSTNDYSPIPNYYSELIAKDRNSMRISGPQ